MLFDLAVLEWLIVCTAVAILGVVATGAHSEIGRISALVAGVQQLTTPLLRQMAQFGRWLTTAIRLVATVSFGVGMLIRDYTASEMFLASVGLPAVMTITLAIGVQRMAHGRSQRHHPAPAGGRDPGHYRRYLLRQDRYPDLQRDDGQHHVKMNTGDHAATAAAIARQVGWANSGAVLTGRELHAMDDEALRRRVVQVNVYARVTPEHKLRLVQLLQEAGMVVAMTGYGVNDAPALKLADAGIAMGLKGTEAAKAAFEMVLADDNFASIANAVEEGRTVYDHSLRIL